MRTIETRRLILRDWRAEDCDDLFEYACLPEVALSAGWKPHRSVEDSLGVIVGLYPESCYALERKESGKVIGNLGFHHTSLCRAYRCLNGREIGFNLHPDHWGQGLMTEACRALCDALFDTEQAPVSSSTDGPLDFLLLAHFTDNERSKRVAQRLGFRYLFDHEQPVAQFDNELRTERLYLLANPHVFGANENRWMKK